MADLFLCLSEHEGFCVPLLEAMVFGVPVVAYDAGAVRETLRGGGVLLADKRPDVVAGAASTRSARDAALRQAVLATQAARARASCARSTSARCSLERLAPVLGAAGGAA